MRTLEYLNWLEVTSYTTDTFYHIKSQHSKYATVKEIANYLYEDKDIIRNLVYASNGSVDMWGKIRFRFLSNAKDFISDLKVLCRDE